MKAIERLDFLRPYGRICPLMAGDPLWDSLRKVLEAANEGQWMAILILSQLALILEDAMRELGERDGFITKLRELL